MTRKLRERVLPFAAERPATPESPDPVVLFARDGSLLAANEAARNAGAPEPGGAPAARVPPCWTTEVGRTAFLDAARERRPLANMEVRQRAGESERVFWISAQPISP